MRNNHKAMKKWERCRTEVKDLVEEKEGIQEAESEVISTEYLVEKDHHRSVEFANEVAMLKMISGSKESHSAITIRSLATCRRIGDSKMCNKLVQL